MYSELIEVQNITITISRGEVILFTILCLEFLVNFFSIVHYFLCQNDQTNGLLIGK